jgi:hypothetical protein
MCVYLFDFFLGLGFTAFLLPVFIFAQLTAANNPPHNFYFYLLIYFRLRGGLIANGFWGLALLEFIQFRSTDAEWKGVCVCVECYIGTRWGRSPTWTADLSLSRVTCMSRVRRTIRTTNVSSWPQLQPVQYTFLYVYVCCVLGTISIGIVGASPFRSPR